MSFGKCKLKPIIRYYFTLTLMDMIKKTIIHMFVGKNVGTPESSHIAGRNII